MYLRVAQRLALRTVIAFTLCIALLPLPGISFLISGAAQGQREEHKPKPKPGKPEGELPDLEDIKQESAIEREPAPPIHSTIRSPKNEGKPWDGRRVGDPEPRGNDRGNPDPDLASNIKRRSNQTRRAHAHARITSPPPPVLHDQFVQNFFTYALVRSPYTNETNHWYDQLRSAYANSSASLKAAGIELGRTLFESAEYAARNRDAHWYVYDLYKTYLMREPDSGGWAMWEGVVPTHGREYVRRGFEESGEFATLSASITTTGSPSSSTLSLISAQTDPRNQPGRGLLSRDAILNVPLLSLPGRNGLDLGLGLSYSSMVWTRSGPYIYFDEDNGFPSPGFRLGFPTVQRKTFDAQTAKNSYLLITPSGRRVELRQVGTSNYYDAADSSYLRLTDNGGTLLVHSTNGTKMSYAEINGEWRCTEIKDRNGNYITVNNNSLGRISTITDTLGRVITFNYDVNSNLISITQAWNGQPSHQWVAFSWGTRNMQYSFSDPNLRGVIGTKNGQALPVITQVTLNDTSHFTFDYSNPVQVSAVRNYFGAIERNAIVFTYDTPAGDAPRLTDSRLTARNWTGYNNVPSPVITTYSAASDFSWCQMTAPDGTIHKEFYGTGWQKGLATTSEVWSGGAKVKWITTAWTQDNTGVSYEANPRITETNVYDSSGNRRRTTIDYGSYWQWGLPYAVMDYAADGVTPIRNTITDYNLSQAYLDRRIIGLVAAIHQTDIVSWQRKIGFIYDDPARLQVLPAAATQHDSSYNTSFTVRGNVTGISRYDVEDIVNPAKALTTYANYYTTGTRASTTDPANHQSSLTYTDSFSDSVSRTTFAYPTTITDADGNSSYLQYNFDHGSTTRTQSPIPAGQTQGAIQTMTYNNLGQLERITTTNNNAYKRFWYGADFTASYATVNSVADQAYSIQVTDGLGRVIGAVTNHPGSTGGYSLVNNVYDLMGRATLTSNPAEVNSSWVPIGDDSAGMYHTQQTYDWQGRPLVTTNPDLTTRTASYAGCGCAGGIVVTLTDEGTLDAGVTKRRQQKIYSDVLGRQVKTEVLNWENGSVYSTTVNTYNARDQIEKIRQYVGADTSGTYQDTTTTYDGYGRIKTRHVPEENFGTNTTWNYNVDDTVSSITDARGATTTFGYAGTNRGLVKTATHAMSGSPTINVSYNYDAVGNRTSMTDATGTTNYSYNQLSQISSESRIFSGVSGTYALNYAYNLAGQLSSLSIPFDSKQIGYNYDNAGRLSGVTGSGFSASYYDWQTQQIYTQSVPNFLSNILYRAWGSKKSMTYGNNVSDSITYNSRLQPASYSISNTKYVIPPTTHTTLSWTFNYYNDGRLKFSGHAVENKWDRSYAYDHAARLKEGATNRVARGQSWNFFDPDPYYQTIGYDAFGHITSRTGSLYHGNSSDSASYANNRRSGWTYDASGNVTNDQSYNHTFDALGSNVQAISVVMAGNGSPEFPSEPVTEITQNYDGDDRPNKRVQLTRMNVYDEMDPEHPLIQVLEDNQTSYYLRSSVLGNRAIVELAPDGTGAFTKLINIYAAGVKIARDDFDSVQYEHHIPSTGSWIVTRGHSNDRGAYRQERDPSGAELPMSDPYASEASYPSMKFAQPLFVDGGDPFDYRSGISVDGIPVSQAQLAHMLDTGVVQAGIFFGGRPVGTIDLSGRGLFGVPTTTSMRIDFYEQLNSDNNMAVSMAPDQENPDNEIATATTSTAVWLGAINIRISLPPMQITGGGHIGPPKRVPLAGEKLKEYNDYKNRLLKLLDNPKSDCSKYLKSLGIDGSRLATTVRGQRAYDGELSTISMEQAGLLARNSSATIEHALVGNVTVQSNQSVMSAFAIAPVTAIQAGHSRTVDGYNDVYYGHSSFLSAEVIAHEALHTLLGVFDKGKGGLNERKLDVMSLFKGGCNNFGQAYKE